MKQIFLINELLDRITFLAKVNGVNEREMTEYLIRHALLCAPKAVQYSEAAALDVAIKSIKEVQA